MRGSGSSEARQRSDNEWRGGIRQLRFCCHPRRPVAYIEHNITYASHAEGGDHGSYEYADHGGRAVSPRGIEEADVGVEDGRVYCLAAPGASIEAARTIDARGRYILTGCVDAHVHNSRRCDPGRARSKAKGGRSQGYQGGNVQPLGDP